MDSLGTEKPRRDFRADALAAAGLIVLMFAAFAPALRNDFVGWDDEQTIVHNPWLNPPTGESLARAWREPRMDLWAPLTYTTWWLVAQIAPGDPRAFHGLDLLLHAAAVACVFALLRQ